MKTLTQIFLRGLVTLLPMALTIYLVYWLAVSSERFLGGLIQQLLPQAAYWPGMGLAAGVALTFAAGLLVRAWLVRSLLALGDRLLESIPLVKTIYTGLRDIFQFASSGGGKEGLSRVVRVSLPNDMQMIGFVTSEQPAWRHEDEPHVAVYIPLSYQIGGHTLLVPPHRLEPLDISVEDAMRLVLTAGMHQGNL
jgi:uncharacterized membrane protein